MRFIAKLKAKVIWCVSTNKRWSWHKVTSQYSNRHHGGDSEVPPKYFHDAPYITIFHYDWPDQESLFFQSTISPQNSSKSMIIHLFFMLLIAIENTTILKSTKSSKSQTKSIPSSCHIITPWKIFTSLLHVQIHPFWHIHFTQHSINESWWQSIVQTLHWFNRFCWKMIPTVSQH